MFSLSVLFFLLLALLATIYGVVNDRMIEEIQLMKKEIRKQEKKLLKEASNGDGLLSIAILYYQLGMKIQEGWMAKNLPGNIVTEALQAFDKASNYSSNSLIVLLPIVVSKGVLLRMMGRGEESLAAYDQVTKSYSLYPIDQATIDYNRADTLVMMGRVKEALKYFAASLKRVPCKAERYYAYITSLKEINELTKDQWNEKLIELKKIEKLCLPLTNNNNKDSIEEEDNDSLPPTNEEEDDDYEDVLPAVYPKKTLIYQDPSLGLDCSKPSDFYYALYQTYDQLKDSSKAWYYLMKAKGIDKQYRVLHFQRDNEISNFNASKLIFTREMIGSFPDVSDEASNVPIFVIGMMRSGSTLIETMLDRHPNIWGMGEDSVFNANLTYLRDNIVRVSSQSSPYEAEEKLRELILDYGDNTVKIMRHTAERLYYVSNQDEMKKVNYIVDKMLFNYKNIPFLHIVYPNSLIIHMIRDPLDTLLSCFKNKFDDIGLEWTLDVKDLVLQYVLYLQYVHQYRRLLPKRILEIRYEGLVYQPEKYLKIILKKLKLYNNTITKELLSFHENIRRVQTNSQSHAEVRQRLYTHSIGQWRKYATQLSLIRDEWMKYYPYLKENNILPYESEINWEMKSDFDYDRYSQLFSSSSEESKDESISEKKIKKSNQRKTKTLDSDEL